MKEETPRATLSLKTKGGIPVLLTITNDMSAIAIEGLFNLVEMADVLATNKSMTPDDRKQAGFIKKEKDWTGEKCPKDQGRLYHMVTKTGKDMVKCENSKTIRKPDGSFETQGCQFYAFAKTLKEYEAKQSEEPNF